MARIFKTTKKIEIVIPIVFTFRSKKTSILNPEPPLQKKLNVKKYG